MTTNISAFGIHQGVESVDANGNFNYRFPIHVPPGINRLHPQIALAYSQHGDNGSCGVGWQIAGLSAICRTPANRATDGYIGTVNFDQNDKLSLDAQRLINIENGYFQPGAVYYTEIHQWKKIVAGQTDEDGFTVYLKSGEKWNYGTTTDSRIMTNDGSKVLIWALSCIEDLNGNQINFSYTRQPVDGLDSTTEDFYIKEISYQSATITFNYLEKHPTPIIHYQHGQQITKTCRLTSISIALPSKPTCLEYQLTYSNSTCTNQSRLSTISIADANGNTLQPIQLDWTDVQMPGLSLQTPSQLSQLDAPMVSPFDYQGMGIMDVFQFNFDNDNHLIAYPHNHTINDGNLSFLNTSKPIKIGNSGDYSGKYKILTGDLKGTGKTDIIIVSEDNGSYICFDYFLSSENYSIKYSTTTKLIWDDNFQFLCFDANADGITDLVIVGTDNDSNIVFYVFENDSIQIFNRPWNYINSKILVSGPGQFEVFTVDVNADMLTDLVIKTLDNDSKIVLSSFITSADSNNKLTYFQPFTSQPLFLDSTNEICFIPADCNGDGLTDFVQISTDNNGDLIFTTIFSKGNGFFDFDSKNPISSIFPINQNITSHNLYPAGINGGSQTCIVHTWLDNDSNLCFETFQSDTDGTFYQQQSNQNIPNNWGGTEPKFLIWDGLGRGKADFFLQYANNNSNIQIQPLVSSGDYPDLLCGITDMLGKKIQVSYATLSDATVYTEQPNPNNLGKKTSPNRYASRLSPAQYPMQQVTGAAFRVVSKYTILNDSSINKHTINQQFNFKYSNALVDLKGRGWQGFETVEKLDSVTGLRKITKYNQEFPYTGSVYSVRTEADGTITQDPKAAGKGTNVLLGLSIHCYNANDFGETSSKYHTLKTVGNIQYHYDYGETNLDFILAKSIGFDDFDNVNLETWWGYINEIDPASILYNEFPNITPISQEEVVYTFRKYSNIATNTQWSLGYLLNEKVSTNAQDNDIETFTEGDFSLSQKVYNPNICTIQSHSVWDSVNQQWLTDSYEYDMYGNQISHTKPDGNTTTCEYDSIYHVYPSKITLPAVAQGAPLFSLSGYDPLFGTKVAEQEPNGCIQLVVLDGFGRAIAKQRSVPEGGTQNDAIQISQNVTGYISLDNVKVLTLESITFGNDGNEVYSTHSQLQSFPTDANRDFLSKTQYIDSLGKERRQQLQSGQQNGDVVVSTEYDVCGKVSQKSVPYFSSEAASFFVTYEYDIYGRPLSIAQPGGNDGKTIVKNTYRYDQGEVVTYTEAAGTDEAYVQQITNHNFHSKYKEVSSCIVSDNKAITSFVFDAIGRLIKTTDPKGIENTSSYDSLNRAVFIDNPDQNTSNNPDKKAVSYSYNTMGKIEKVTFADDSFKTFVYDQLGRKIKEEHSDGKFITFEYDNPNAQNGLGRLTSVETFSKSGVKEVSKSFGYDIYGNLTSQSLNIDGLDNPLSTSYIFDPAKRVCSQTLPDGSQLTSTYNDGLLVETSLGEAALAFPLESYNAVGNCTETASMCSANKILNSSYNYNPLGALYQEQHQNAEGTDLLNFSFNYDNLNQIFSVNELVNNSNEAYIYQNKRLVNSNIPAEGLINFNYDSSGNILSNNVGTYTYANNNHFPTTIENSNNQTVYAATQDACGRTQSRTRNGITQTFTYDINGNLLASAQNGKVCTMIYDENGQKVKETQFDGTVIYYISPNYHLKVEQSGGQSVQVIHKYLYDHLGAALSVETKAGADTILFYRRDHKGNITHVFDHTGKICKTIAYSAFGLMIKTSGETAITPSYEGKLWSEDLGLYYFNARYYDPQTGSFLTPDTQLGGRSHLQANVWNRFAFELNNPTNHIDPTGHFSWKALGEGILGGVVGTVVTILAFPVAGPLALAVGALAEAGIQEAFSHASAKQFGLNFSADLATMAINMVVSMGALLATPETGGASLIAAGIAIGFVAGAVSGFADSTVSQAITNKGHVDWKDVGYATAISAGIGAAVGGIGAKSGALLETKDTGLMFSDTAKLIYNNRSEYSTLEDLSKLNSDIIESMTNDDLKRIGKFLFYRVAWDENISPYKSDKA